MDYTYTMLFYLNGQRLLQFLPFIHPIPSHTDDGGAAMQGSNFRVSVLGEDFETWTGETRGQSNISLLYPQSHNPHRSHHQLSDLTIYPPGPPMEFL